MDFRTLLIFISLCTGLSSICSGQKPGTTPENLTQVKNIIMMIPDGTSTSVLSLARWYQNYYSTEITWLNIDEIVTGLVKTHCSDAPIGDSGATGSAYASGIVSQDGYISTYPEKTPNDLVPTDAARANAPAMTILEAAKIKGMSTGIAVTSYFTHTTPAAFAAHTYNGNRNDWISQQMVYNHIDVVFGGGTDYLMAGHRQYLNQRGWDIIIDDYNKFRAYNGTKVWGLFAPRDLPYDLERNQSAIPSLAEMTRKATDILSKNENGFFLMVEGSKIDWAAHDNDPIGIITEFLAFDNAVKEALEFAKANGNTAVIICPDHGNSAISMGNEASSSRYSKLTKQQLLGPIVACKYTAEGFANRLIQIEFNDALIRKLFADDMGINDLTEPELYTIQNAMSRRNLAAVKNVVIQVVNSRTFLGFTTGGHTGEDVFLACYHPNGEVLKGIVANTEVNKYMSSLLGIPNLADSTQKYFAGHKTLFPETHYRVSWDKKDFLPSLTVTNKKTKKSFTVKTFDSRVSLKGTKRRHDQLETIVLYVDKNEEFYLPRELKDLID